MNTKSILVVDDESSTRMAISESLINCGYEVETARDGEEALGKFRKKIFEAVITDMRMPRISGMEVLRGIRKISARTPVVVITAYGTVNTAVEAMKDGASDFIMKPFSLEHIESVVKNLISKNGGGNNAKEDKTQESLSSEKVIITKDEKVLSLLGLLKDVSKSRSSILIRGESGTGKELFARYIHRHSNRASMPFIAVNCAAIPHNLLESEMFGFEKGAFTGASMRRLGKFEMAHRGTLLLDEISEMDPQLQAKLLRVVQESEVDRLGAKFSVPVDVRIIATTNTDLKKRIAEERFREDLFYRLNVIPVRVPPLRERRADIVILSDYFLEKYSRLNGMDKPVLSAGAAKVLESYRWPGNVRELENVIERSVLICGGNSIQPEHLYMENETGGSVKTALNLFHAGDVTLREAEKRLILETLEKVKGNRTKASEILGISVRTMRNKLNEYKKEVLSPTC